MFQCCEHHHQLQSVFQIFVTNDDVCTMETCLDIKKYRNSLKAIDICRKMFKLLTNKCKNTNLAADAILDYITQNPLP